MGAYQKHTLSELKDLALGNKETSEVEVYEITTASMFVLSAITRIDDDDYDIRIDMEDVLKYIKRDEEIVYIKEDGIKIQCIKREDPKTNSTHITPVHSIWIEYQYEILKNLIIENLS